MGYPYRLYTQKQLTKTRQFCNKKGYTILTNEGIIPLNCGGGCIADPGPIWLPMPGPCAIGGTGPIGGPGGADTPMLLGPLPLREVEYGRWSRIC